MPLPDRIDFCRLADGRIAVTKMRRDGARDVAISHNVRAADFGLDAALDWCREHGYTVHVWRGGARAWRGEPWVIRTRLQIWRKREQVERETADFIRRNPGKPTPGLTFLDFAYDG